MASLNLSDYRNEILLLLRETASDSHFSPSQLTSYVNKSIEMTALLSESAKDFIEIEPEPNVGAYTLPSDNLLIKSAYYGDKKKQNDVQPIDVVSENELRVVHPSWLEETSANTGKPIRLLVLDKFTVFLDPIPNSTYADGAKKLTLFYVYSPQPLVLDSDIANISMHFQPIQKFYGAYLAYLSLQNVDMSAKCYSDYITHYKLVSGLAARDASQLSSFRFDYVEQ